MTGHSPHRTYFWQAPNRGEARKRRRKGVFDDASNALSHAHICNLQHGLEQSIGQHYLFPFGPRASWQAPGPPVRSQHPWPVASARRWVCTAFRPGLAWGSSDRAQDCTVPNKRQ
eukprot:3214221-Pyramimonas_sp.AAC.1